MNPRKTITFSIVMLIATIFVMSFAWPNNILATFSMTMIVAVSFYFYRTKHDIVHFSLAAVIGTIAEAICITFGAWSYSNPTFIIPIWLPLVWGAVALHLPRISKAIIDLRRSCK